MAKKQRQGKAPVPIALAAFACYKMHDWARSAIDGRWRLLAQDFAFGLNFAIRFVFGRTTTSAISSYICGLRQIHVIESQRQLVRLATTDATTPACAPVP
jgi:hypothetical protein